MSKLPKFILSEDAYDKSGYKLFRFILDLFTDGIRKYPVDKFLRAGTFQCNVPTVLDNLDLFESGDIKDIAECFKL